MKGQLMANPALISRWAGGQWLKLFYQHYFNPVVCVCVCLHLYLCVGVCVWMHICVCEGQ
jgi:hypothetical protein